MKSEDVEGATHRPDCAIGEAFCSDFLQSLFEQGEILVEFVRASIMMESSRERGGLIAHPYTQGQLGLEQHDVLAPWFIRMLADDRLGCGIFSARSLAMASSSISGRFLKVAREGESFGKFFQGPMNDDHRIQAHLLGVFPR